MSIKDSIEKVAARISVEKDLKKIAILTGSLETLIRAQMVVNKLEANKDAG